MSSSRRLSRGATSNLGDIDSSDDEMTLGDTTTLTERGLGSLGPRRRSSLGGKGNRNPVDQKEQSRIADMYKTVIKLAAENKITAKNSWNLELIDHMGTIIQEDGGDRDAKGSINFQKASCTLDASVKIYSHRVDDTYSTSFRILENLSRSNNVEDGDDADGDESKRAARVGSKAISNRLNLTATIEKNIDSLNSDNVDSEHTADPLFHKMSQAFDEGGAKGMLMANLRITPGSCNLCFSNSEAVEETNEAANGSIVDVTDLIVHCGFTPLSLVGLPVSATLQQYRNTLGLGAASISTDATAEIYACKNVIDENGHVVIQPMPTASIASYASASPSSAAGSGPSIHESFDDDEDVGNIDDIFGDDMDDAPTNVRRSSILLKSPAHKRIASTPAKDSGGWDAVFGEGAEECEADVDSGNRQSMGSVEPTIVVPTAASAGDEYSYFDAAALQDSGLHWAGARHWKMPLRSALAKTKAAEFVNTAATPSAEVAAADDKVVAKASKAKTVKQVFKFDFTQAPIDIPSMVPKASRRGDGTTQTITAIEKAKASAGDLMLPQDAKFSVKDLCRMFLRPRLLVPPEDLESFMKASILKQKTDLSKSGAVLGGSVPSSMYGEQDFLWGSFASSNNGNALKSSIFGFKSNVAPTYNLDDDNSAGYDDVDDADFDDAPGDDDVSPANGPPTNRGASIDQVMAQMQGLNINSNNLLQATRVVEKVDIGYATVAKRVNVKKLKTDIWSHLDSSLIPKSSGTIAAPGIDGAENEGARKPEKRGRDDDLKATLTTGSSVSTGPAANATSELSFQELINDIAVEQKQKDVSLSFYFICLLHLANEKNLEIAPIEAMSDLIIRKN